MCFPARLKDGGSFICAALETSFPSPVFLPEAPSTPVRLPEPSLWGAELIYFQPHVASSLKLLILLTLQTSLTAAFCLSARSLDAVVALGKSWQLVC